MRRIFLSCSAALVACTPSSQEAAMRKPSTISPAVARSSVDSPTELDSTIADQAAQGPIPEPVLAAANPAPKLSIDTPAAALGRRTLSAGFVRIGPGGHLTVELRDGRMMVLRDVVMRAKDYCGVLVPADAPNSRFCGAYADVAAAWPTGAPTVSEPDLVGADLVKPVPAKPVRRPFRPR